MNKKAWRTILQLIITILTAIISTFFTESCIKPRFTAWYTVAAVTTVVNPQPVPQATVCAQAMFNL